MIQHLLNIDVTISEVPNNTSITRCNKGNAMILERIYIYIYYVQYQKYIKYGEIWRNL